MYKRYFRMKDPKCRPEQVEWIEMTGREFYRFVNSPEGQGRHFIDMDDVVLEASETEARSFRTEQNHSYYIQTQEAEIVRSIFADYLSGMGIEAIMKKLNAQGKPSRNGHAWCRSSVRKVLGNYSYTGNLLLQTTFRENHITKKTPPQPW